MWALAAAWWLTLKPTNDGAWQAQAAQEHKFRARLPDVALCLCSIVIAVVFIASFSTGVPELSAQSEVSAIPIEELDSLVAPIALYPDPLLAQTLAAST